MMMAVACIRPNSRLRTLDNRSKYTQSFLVAFITLVFLKSKLLLVQIELELLGCNLGTLKNER